MSREPKSAGPEAHSPTPKDFFQIPANLIFTCGSACGPVIVPVFKTGGWHLAVSPVGSTPTRFRQISQELVDLVGIELEAFARRLSRAPKS